MIVKTLLYSDCFTFLEVLFTCTSSFNRNMPGIIFCLNVQFPHKNKITEDLGSLKLKRN